MKSQTLPFTPESPLFHFSVTILDAITTMRTYRFIDSFACFCNLYKSNLILLALSFFHLNLYS